MGIENHVPKEMQDAVREILAGRHIGYLGAVHHEVKPDRFENRLLALTEYRLFVLHYKVPTKVESNIFYLDLQSIRSPSTKSLVFGTGQRNLTFNCQENDTRGFDAALHYVIKSLVTVFPSVPLERVLPKLTLSASRLTGVNEQVKQLQQKEPGPCGGFSTTYKCTSDYHGNLFLDEVAWDIDTIYLSHDSHHLNIGDFDHLEPRHLPPLISALEHNTWFTGITAENIAKLGPDAQREIVKVMRKNVTIEELCLSNSGIRWDFVQQLSQSLMTNANSPLSKLDLSSNAIEDKGMNAMHQPITQLSRGLTHLDLSRTAITARGVNRLAEALQANKFMSTTLQYLNLSDNLLKGEELANLFNFLAQPNAVIELNLSGTECALEGLFGALLRGCTTKLQYLRVARNVFTHRKGRDWQVPKAWHRFLASSFSLKLLDLAETRLPLEAVKMVLLGIGSNINENHVELILSGNGLGMAGPEFIQTSLSNLNYISSLDLSDNAFDNLIPLLAEHLAHSRHLKKLHIGKNFSGIKPKNMTQVLEALVQLVQDEDVGMEMLSLADSKLKLDTVVIINALGGNVSLTEIDITGNHMGDIGARMLAKALQINTYLQVVHWDKNNTTPQGLTDVASALEKNFSMRKMPTPVVDSAVAIRLNTEKTTKALCKIENLLQRNHSPRKFASDQAFRLQQGLLLSSTQQMVDQLVLQVQDSLKRILRVGVSADAQSDVKRATAFVKEAEKATQILPRLQEVAMQFEMEGNPIHRNLQSLAANLHTVIENQLKKNLSYMLKCTEDQCPTIMTEKALRSELEQACTDKSYLADGFTQSLMVEQVGTDVTNKVGELNLAVAAHISESVVDSVLRSLESSNKILLRHLKTASLRPSVSESIKAEEADSVSPFRKKETTLIAAPPESLKVSTLKRRSRRPQSVIVQNMDNELMSRSPDLDPFTDAADVEKARRLTAEAKAQEGIKESGSESGSPCTPRRTAGSPLTGRRVTGSPSTPRRTSASPSMQRRTPIMESPKSSPASSEKPTTPVPAPRHSRMKRSESGSSQIVQTPSPTGSEKKHIGSPLSVRGSIRSNDSLREDPKENTAEKVKVTPPETSAEFKEEEAGGGITSMVETVTENLEDSDEEDMSISEKLSEKVDIQEDTRSVDTIDSLDASTLESSLDNSSRGSTPSCDAVSSPSKSRRSQSSALDEELDSVAPLDPSGPKLQHLAKARPKRAKTRAMSKAVLSNEEIKTEGPDVVEFFSTKPVNTVPISPPPSSKQKTPKITPEPKHKANKQEKDDVIAPKKKGWSPSLPTIPTKGLTGLFHKKNTHSSPETSRKNQEESSDRSGAKTPDRDRKEAKTPDRSKTPDLDKSSTSNRSKTPDSDRSGASTPDKDRSRPSDKDLSPMVVEKEEPEVRSPPMMKAPKAGMPGGMPGMGGLLAEMKQKRKTMHPAADDKKEKKEPVTKEAIPTRPPPPSSSQNRSSQRPYSVYANDSKLIASPNSGKGDKPDEKGDDVSSNGSFGKGRPAVPARLKPPLVPPKPRPVSTASALTPNPSPEVSPNPKSKAPQPPKKFSVRAYLKRFQEPDESTDQADSPPEPTVRRRSSVRDKVSLLDRNSNEKQPIESKQKSSTLPSGDQPTDTDVPQRSLSTGSQSTNTPHRLSAFTQSSSKKADDRDNSDGDLKPNGNAAKSEEGVFV